jgi:hypothetical protein
MQLNQFFLISLWIFSASHLFAANTIIKSKFYENWDHYEEKRDTSEDYIISRFDSKFGIYPGVGVEWITANENGGSVSVVQNWQGYRGNVYKLKNSNENNSTVSIEKHFSPPINISSYKSIRLKCFLPTRRAGYTSAYIVFATNNKNYYLCNSPIPGSYFTGPDTTGWVETTIDTNQLKITGTPSFADISYIGIKFISSNVPDSLCIYLAKLSMSKSSARKGIIMFSWDDAFKGMYVYAKPVLDKYGYKSWIHWRGDKLHNSPGNTIAYDQANELQKNGWQIGNHTLTHPYLDSVPDNRVIYEIKTVTDSLREHGFRLQRIFAPPGNRRKNESEKILKRYFDVSRVYINNSHNFTETNPMGDIFTQRSIDIGIASLSIIKQYIDSVASRKSLMIFYGHDCSPTDSSAITIPLAKLDSIVSYVHSMETLGLIEVKNLNEYLKVNTLKSFAVRCSINETIDSANIVLQDSLNGVLTIIDSTGMQKGGSEFVMTSNNTGVLDNDTRYRIITYPKTGTPDTTVWIIDNVVYVKNISITSQSITFNDSLSKEIDSAKIFMYDSLPGYYGWTLRDSSSMLHGGTTAFFNLPHIVFGLTYYIKFNARNQSGTCDTTFTPIIDVNTARDNVVIYSKKTSEPNIKLIQNRNILVNCQKKGYRISVQDIQGRCVDTRMLQIGDNKLGPFRSGIWLLILTNNGKVLNSQKLIVL